MIMEEITTTMGEKKSFDGVERSEFELTYGSHIFHVRDYSSAKGSGSGHYLASDTFNVGGYEWVIYFYPDGKYPEDNAKYVSCFIALVSDISTDVQAIFEMTLMDRSGKQKHQQYIHHDGAYTLKKKGTMWGYKRMYLRNSLDSSEYLKDDCLTIKVSVGVMIPTTDPQGHASNQDLVQEKHANLKKLKPLHSAL